MANKNYIAGRSFEYATMRQWEVDGFLCLRTAGSHGAYDVIALKKDCLPYCIQCKIVPSEAEAHRLAKKLMKKFVPSNTYVQVVTIKVKGSKKPITYYCGE